MSTFLVGVAAPSAVAGLLPPSAPPSVPALPSANFVVQIDFGRVQNLGVISQGSFGLVYKARLAHTLVAVKELLYQPSQDAPEFVQLFNHELTIIREVRHPNILQYLYHNSVPPHLCIMTELLPGSLKQFVANPSNTLTIESAVRIATGIARGMAFLHSLQPPVLHRNLSADHVLLTKELEPKIAGFGLSKVRDMSARRTGKVLQLTNWLPPEVLANNPFTLQSDVYMYGMVLWEMFSRAVPFDMYQQQGYVAVSQAILRSERPMIPSWTPKPFFDLIYRCWLPDPRQRPLFEQILQYLHQQYPSLVEI